MRMPLRILLGVVVVACASGLPHGESTERQRLQKRAAASGGQSFGSSPTFNSVGSASGAFKIPLQLGCAAALLCVEEQYCTLDGTISPEPVALTSKQILRRVPLSSCRNPSNGVVGKCCRDPNYVDPWPATNLPANYSGGFDEQGFPTFVNIAKVQPPAKRIPLTKTVVSTVAPPKINFGITKGQPVHPSPSPDLPLQPSGQRNIFVSGVVESTLKPFVTPHEELTFPAEVPQVPATTDQLPQTILPIPDHIAPALIPRPFHRSNYDSASSNENPSLIATHPIRNQCGIKNNFPRPEGLRDSETAFGEIPWQAMILLNPRRQILCSGAIIEPTVVLTAAHCVAGFHPQDLAVKSGEWKLGYELVHEEPLPFEILNVSRVMIHPGYVQGSASNDMAIVLLDHPVSYNTHVNTICYGNDLQIQETAECIVTGWGKMILQIHAAGAIMNSIDVDLLPHDVCEERISGVDSEYQLNINGNMICTRAHKQNNNMCQVDPGSPLACKRGNGAYELVGLYSQENSCIPTNQVATFSQIDAVWIKTSLNSLSDDSQPSFEVFPPVHTPDQDVEPDAQQDNYEYRKSSLPPDHNKYLPPVKYLPV